MRKLLILALLLCKCLALVNCTIDGKYNVNSENANIIDNIVAMATRAGSYDYDDIDGSKRHSILDDRRNWRKKALLKPMEEHKEWDRRRHDYDNQRYIDDTEPKIFGGIDRQRDLDDQSPYRQPQGPRHYDDEKLNLQQALKSAEAAHSAAYM